MRNIFALLVLSAVLLGIGSPLAALGLNEKAPIIKGETIDGREINTDTVGKPVIAVFWATWCPACKTEIPVYNKLVELIGDEVQIVGINIGVNDSEERVKKYVEKYKIKYPVLFDEGSLISQRYHVMGTPTVVIIGRDGELKYLHYFLPEDFGRYLKE